MKPFDLEKAKEGHPLITRDGIKAKYEGACDYDSYAIFVFVHGFGDVAYTKDGKYWADSTLPHDYDLFLTD